MIISSVEEPDFEAALEDFDTLMDRYEGKKKSEKEVALVKEMFSGSVSGLYKTLLEKTEEEDKKNDREAIIKAFKENDVSTLILFGRLYQIGAITITGEEEKPQAEKDNFDFVIEEYPKFLSLGRTSIKVGFWMLGGLFLVAKGIDFITGKIPTSSDSSEY